MYRETPPLSTSRAEKYFQLRKVAGPENRSDYSMFDPDLFYRNHLRTMQTARSDREVAERYLRGMHDSDAPALEGMRRNLRNMHAFYTRMESFFSDFSALWLEDKQRRDNDRTT